MSCRCCWNWKYDKKVWKWLVLISHDSSSGEWRKKKVDCMHDWLDHLSLPKNATTLYSYLCTKLSLRVKFNQCLCYSYWHCHLPPPLGTCLLSRVRERHTLTLSYTHAHTFLSFSRELECRIRNLPLGLAMAHNLILISPTYLLNHASFFMSVMHIPKQQLPHPIQPFF